MKIIEEELGSPIETFFSYISEEHVAAASFGQVSLYLKISACKCLFRFQYGVCLSFLNIQVYRGRTVDGISVAVKVQRPNMLHVVVRDVYILRLGVCTVFQWCIIFFIYIYIIFLFNINDFYSLDSCKRQLREKMTFACMLMNQGKVCLGNQIIIQRPRMQQSFWQALHITFNSTFLPELCEFLLFGLMLQRLTLLMILASKQVVMKGNPPIFVPHSLMQIILSLTPCFQCFVHHTHGDCLIIRFFCCCSSRLF